MCTRLLTTSLLLLVHILNISLTHSSASQSANHPIAENVCGFLYSKNIEHCVRIAYIGMSRYSLALSGQSVRLLRKRRSLTRGLRVNSRSNNISIHCMAYANGYEDAWLLKENNPSSRPALPTHKSPSLSEVPHDARLASNRKPSTQRVNYPVVQWKYVHYSSPIPHFSFTLFICKIP